MTNKTHPITLPLTSTLLAGKNQERRARRPPLKCFFFCKI